MNKSERFLRDTYFIRDFDRKTRRLFSWILWGVIGLMVLEWVGYPLVEWDYLRPFIYYMLVRVVFDIIYDYFKEKNNRPTGKTWTSYEARPL